MILEKYLLKDIFCLFLFLSISTGTIKTGATELTKFPKGATPQEIGLRLSERFLEQSHSQYGSPMRANEPRTQITYPDVCTWLGGLWFAKVTNNKSLTNQLEARFLPLFNSEKYLLPVPNHVDNNVFGALALELYIQTKSEKYLKMGIMYADTQWQLPADSINSPVKRWSDKGYSWQTRIWLDDMFMITAVQGQASRVTGNKKYINRAAKEMVLYLDSIQTPNGLFYHAPTAPFYWGRGNGWLAVGMAVLLRTLPNDNENKPVIMKAYLKMMNTLLRYQSKSGMWKQLIDDPKAWDESSCTAMFTYAMITGVKNGWLNADSFGVAARKGWLALVSKIDENGDLNGVCEGTNIGTNREHYLSRLALSGDLHGQATTLWCAYALLSKK